MGWYAYEESRKEMMTGKAFIGEFKYVIQHQFIIASILTPKIELTKSF